ncbi:Centromere protein X [Galemys pyrenaicus]|uniref:Centromere protein X n=1 Tax=Galemys pyrenaicus TaxID=202257 RepID=A0A8J5ZUN4_GALPY|nr:Centromere protein X [Galemys pyrenaicus]
MVLLGGQAPGPASGAQRQDPSLQKGPLAAALQPLLRTPLLLPQPPCLLGHSVPLLSPVAGCHLPRGLSWSSCCLPAPSEDTSRMSLKLQVLGRHDTPCPQELVSKLLCLHFKDDKTRVGGDALQLMAELLRIFVMEAAVRSVRQAQAEDLTRVDVDHLEKVLPQLVGGPGVGPGLLGCPACAPGVLGGGAALEGRTRLAGAGAARGLRLPLDVLPSPGCPVRDHSCIAQPPALPRTDLGVTPPQLRGERGLALGGLGFKAGACGSH